jgi:hypothetical protein
MSGDRVKESYYFKMLNFSKDGIKTRLASDTGRNVSDREDSEQNSKASSSFGRGLEELESKRVLGKKKNTRASNFRERLEEARVQNRNIRRMKKHEEKIALEQMLGLMKQTFSLGITMSDSSEEETTKTWEDNIIKYLNEIASEGLVDHVGVSIFWKHLTQVPQALTNQECAKALISHVSLEPGNVGVFEKFSVDREYINAMLIKENTEKEIIKGIVNDNVGIVQIIKKPHGNALVEIFDNRGEVPDSLLDLIEKTVNVYYEGRS